MLKSNWPNMRRSSVGKMHSWRRTWRRRASCRTRCCRSSIRDFRVSASPEATALRFHHFFRSCSGVGGDFFHVFQISDSVAGVLICDVMGHGVRAALVAMILRTLVEDSRARAIEPAKFLQELNRGISHILKHTRLEIF